MVCVPARSDATVIDPLPAVNVAEPRLVVPSKKVTVPVGVPAPGVVALTVAVNVTA